MAFPVTLNGRTYTLADFSGTTYVEGFPDALEDFVTQAGDIYNSTSTTSNAISTGAKTFTVEASKPYQAGTPLRIADAAAPATNFLDAIVTSYSGTSLVVSVFGIAGSGTYTSWTVNIGGAKTVDGTLPIVQGGTGATTAVNARTNLGLGAADSPSFAGLTATTADINGGTIDGTVIGGTTPAAISGTTLTATTSATLQHSASTKLATTATGIDVTGTVTVSGGVHLGGTGSANLLDDYEEGTWTPTVLGSTTAGTYEIGAENSTYTKTGNTVHLNMFASMSGVLTEGGSGSLFIGGLPFAKGNNKNSVGSVRVSGIDLTAGAINLFCSFNTNSVSSQLFLGETIDNAASTTVPITAIAAGDLITLSITYMV